MQQTITVRQNEQLLQDLTNFACSRAVIFIILKTFQCKILHWVASQLYYVFSSSCHLWDNPARTINAITWIWRQHGDGLHHENTIMRRYQISHDIYHHISMTQEACILLYLVQQYSRFCQIAHCQ